MKQIEVVAAIIQDTEGGIFATQKGNGEWKDFWEFPRGKMDAGAIVLEPRALNARYVMLHNGLSGTLYKLKGAGPRFMSKEALQKKGFENLEHEYYLTYSFDTGQSQDYTYIPGLERGRSTYKPWFATWEELMH